MDSPDLSPGSSPWDTNRTNRTRSSGGKYESAHFLTPASFFSDALNLLQSNLEIAAKELEVLLKATTYSTAMEILLEGRVFDSQEALEKRLVNRVVNDEDVKKEAYKSAELICEGAPKVARWHKEFARNILKKGKVTEKINNLGYKCYDTEDFKIGYQSFLNKTKPKFKNK